MKKVKIEKVAKAEKIASKVERYTRFKNSPMCRISGSFMGGGFNMSRNKVAAVLSLAKELRAFAAGELDEEILALGDDEALEV